MTDSEKLQVVREKIKTAIQEAWNNKPYATYGIFLNDCAESILAIDGIEIRCEDQSLPAINETGDYLKDLDNLHIAYKEANFVKVVKK